MENTTTLILEGGALRGVYTSGVLDALMEHGIYIPNVVGVSAGSLNALSYLSQQPGRSQKINISYVHDSRYMGPSHWLKNFSFFNFDFIFEDVFHNLNPFDYDTFYNSPQSMWAVATDCRTGKPLFYHDKEMGEDFFNACRASASMPLLSRMVKVGDDVCLDGGIACCIPLPEELPFPSGKRVVVLTRQKGAVKQNQGSAINRMYRRRYQKHPELMEACIKQPQDYNRRVQIIDQMEQAGEVFVLRPQTPVTVSRTERDTAKLQALYEQGYQETLARMDELKAYLGIGQTGESASPHLDVSGVCNPLGIPEAAKRAATLQLEQADRYPDPDCTALRQAIAQRYDVLAKGVMVGAGADDLLYRLVLSMQPKRALVVEPVYEQYQRALQQVGCEVVSFQLDPQQDFKLDVQQLKNQLTDDLDLLFLCNPGNPTGKLVNRETLMQLVQHCAEKNILCVVDESFMEMTQSGEDESLKQDAVYCPKLLVLDSFAKAWAMAGLRVGFCISSDVELLHKMANCGQPFGVSAPAQAAAQAVLQQQEYLQKTRKLLKQEIPWMQEQLEQLGLKVFPTQTNFFLVQGPAGLEPLLQQSGIVVRSCSEMAGTDDSYCRIAVKRHSQNQILIERLKKIKEQTNWKSQPEND